MLGLARNHYDRLGHFAQGFVPAIITREVLLRKTPLERGWMVVFPGVLRVLGVKRVLRIHRMVGCVAGGTGVGSVFGNARGYLGYAVGYGDGAQWLDPSAVVTRKSSRRESA